MELSTTRIFLSGVGAGFADAGAVLRLKAADQVRIPRLRLGSLGLRGAGFAGATAGLAATAGAAGFAAGTAAFEASVSAGLEAAAAGFSPVKGGAAA